MSHDSAVALFAIRADRCPQILNRLTGLFAQSDLIPQSVQARSGDDHMVVRIIQSGISEHRASIIAEKMRVIVTVRSVDAEWSDVGVLADRDEGVEAPTVLA
ncbi:MAG: hypothetical protein ABW023_12470 [Sphingomonas sp.]